MLLQLTEFLPCCGPFASVRLPVSCSVVFGESYSMALTVVHGPAAWLPTCCSTRARFPACVRTWTFSPGHDRQVGPAVQCPLLSTWRERGGGVMRMPATPPPSFHHVKGPALGGTQRKVVEQSGPEEKPLHSKEESWSSKSPRGTMGTPSAGGRKPWLEGSGGAE